MRQARAVVLGLSVLAVSHGAIFVRLADAPALAIAAWRVTLATLCFVLLNGSRPVWEGIERPDRWRLLLAGLLLAGHFATWIASLELTSISRSVLLVQTSPIWVVLFGMLFAVSRPTRALAAAAGVGVVGAAIVTMAPGHADQIGSVQGDVLALTGGACLGAYLLVAGGLRRRLSFLSFMVLCNGIAAAGLWLVVFVSGTVSTGFDLTTWLAIAGLAVVSQVLGHGGCNWALAGLEPGVVAIALLGEPLLASALGWLFFGEPVAPTTMAGGLLILLAVYLTIRIPAPSAAPR